jgi:DNA ligase-1
MSEFPVLFHKAKTGALHQWRVFVEGDTIFTEHGQVGGQLQVTPGKKCQGKNQGKKNATTAEQQAVQEANAMWHFKLERKYSETKEEAAEPLFLPMLAHPIEKVKPKDLVFPAHVQPKLDGVRCIASWDGNEIRLMSRAGKPYSLPHVEQALADHLPKGWVFDGELYRHGLSCQTITSHVKRQQAESLEIQYHIYDIPQIDGDDSLPWERRFAELDRLILSDKGLPFALRGVRTVLVDKLDQVYGYQGDFIQDGFEGAMLRLPGSLYEWGYRSKSLLKVKTFQDAEFEVLDVIEGEGKMKGCGIYVCRNDLTDAVFNATPACSMEDRAAIFRYKQNYIGKKLTVKFFDRTEDQVPRFPVAKLIRAEEDLG